MLQAKKTNRIRLAASLILFAVVLAGCSTATQTSTSNSGSSQKDKAPAFSHKDYSGKTVSLSDFAGQPIVVNSWAVWCPFCKAELKDFAVIQKEFGDKVTIIAIDRAESLELAKQFSDELGVTDDLVMLLDPSDSFYKSIGGFAMPETIFVDGDGNIVSHKRGVMKADEIRQRIQDTLDL